MNKKHIVISALHSKTGGGLTYINGLLQELSKQHNVQITVLRHKQYARLIQKHDHIHYIDIPSPKNKILGTLWEQVIVPFYSYKLKADHTLFNTNFCAFAAKSPSIIIHTDGGVLNLVTDWRKRLYWQAINLLTKLSIKRAQHIFTVSESVANTWLEPTAPEREKVQVIYAGVKPSQTGADAPFDDNFFNIVTVGDVYPQKNYTFLAKALQAVSEKEPSAKLHIIGTVYDEVAKNQFFQKVGEYGLQNRVHFHGRKSHKETLGYILHADVYVTASQVEALNIPLIEAQLLETPIVASNIPAHREVLSHKEDLVDTNIIRNVPLFASKIIATQSSTTDQKNPLLSEFSWSKVAEKILNKLS